MTKPENSSIEKYLPNPEVPTQIVPCAFPGCDKDYIANHGVISFCTSRCGVCKIRWVGRTPKEYLETNFRD